MRISSILCFVFCLLEVSFGQVQNEHVHHNGDHITRCSTDESHERLLNENPEYKIKRKKIEEQIQEFMINRDVVDGIIVIPVVYHVIHNGDPIGSGENLPESLLLSQLEQMTDDFRRMNSDAGNTPSDFTSVAADTEIEFCLTSIDENGDPHSGINRINISTLSGVSESDCWTQSYIDNNIKIPTVWDDVDILNIWTTSKIEKLNPACEDGILGYAQFPGMAANTDGIVLLSTTVGSIDNPNPNGGNFAIGRTGTHEVGHYLDLYHIFQGAGCGSDLVADTPTHDGPNYTGSPCTYPGPNNCTDSPIDFPDMFMNYMDYSDDACMNLFTIGQKARMIAAINVSRPGLLTAQCGPTCGDNLTVNGVLNGDYKANITIASSGSIPNGNDVEFLAGQIVTLNGGFEASYGGGLEVNFGDCSSTFSNQDEETSRMSNDLKNDQDRIVNPIDTKIQDGLNTNENEYHKQMIINDRTIQAESTKVKLHKITIREDYRQFYEEVAKQDRAKNY